MTTQTQSLQQAQSMTPVTIVLAVVTGILLLTASGVAQATVMHDSAHDQRHAMAFPCH